MFTASNLNKIDLFLFFLKPLLNRHNILRIGAYSHGEK